MTNNENLSIMTELHPIAKRMREREEQILAGKKNVRANMGEVLAIAVEQGKDATLIKAKLGKSATFADWCAAHVPNMSIEDSAKYVRLSQEWTERMAGQWMFLFQENEPRSINEPKRLPPNEREVLWGRIAKLNSALTTIDIEAWTEQDKELTRHELEPTAKLLWPERFD